MRSTKGALTRQKGKIKNNQIERERNTQSSQLVVAMPSLQGINGWEGGISHHYPTPQLLVELLRVRNCTAIPEPVDRRRSKMRGRISLPLPLRRLREEPSREPRRRLWSKTDVFTLESRWLYTADRQILANDKHTEGRIRKIKSPAGTQRCMPPCLRVCGTNRGWLALWSRARFILQFQTVLSILSNCVDLVDLEWDLSGVGRWWGDAILPIFGLLGKFCPTVLSSLLALFSGIHPLIILMGTFIEELWVDFHEHLHGIVHHTVDRPGTISATVHDQDKLQGKLTCSSDPWSFRIVAQT